MNPLIRLKMIILPFFTALVLGFLGLLPKAQAVVPAPDGGYPGFNTAEGQNALLSLTTGSANTAVGWFSLWSNIDGSNNTAVGAGTLLFNVGDQSTLEGLQNTAVGTAALLFNTTGSNNTALGVLALENNDSGGTNTAVGYRALESNTEGDLNTGVGGSALANNTAGAQNTALGFTALFLNTTGSHNTAVGQNAGRFITGDGNTALGDQAGRNITSGTNNICIGRDAGFGFTTTDSSIAIGLAGENGASPRCYIGNIRGVTVANADGINVIIDSDGQLGTSNSSRRFKKDIKPMEQASEAILALKPVTFHYKDADTKKAADTPQFGLIAEDVAEVNPGLVVYEDHGQPLSVRYEAVNAMLLNEFLKEHRKGQQQDRKIEELEATVTKLQSVLKEQAAQIQKVSDKLELSKFATGRSAVADLRPK